jgi:hypothetical protein
MSMMVLVENERAQRRSEVSLAHFSRKLADETAAIRDVPPFHSVAGVVAIYPDVLYREILVSFEPAALGDRFRCNADDLVNRQRARLLSLALATTLALLFLLALLSALQLRRLNIRLGLLALQPSDFISQCLDLLLLKVTELQQHQYRRRNLIGGKIRDLRKLPRAGRVHDLTLKHKLLPVSSLFAQVSVGVARTY